jgi:hypothetical protein
MNQNHARRSARTERTAGRALSRLKAYAPFGLIAVVMLAAMLMMSTTALGGSGGTGATSSSGDGGGNKYDRLWDDLSKKQHRWARKTSDCESGGDPTAHGGGGTYHGAFQFMKSTWKSAPKSPGGDPHRYRWKVQAVVAVYLKKKSGAKSNWPNCG